LIWPALEAGGGIVISEGAAGLITAIGGVAGIGGVGAIGGSIFGDITLPPPGATYPDPGTGGRNAPPGSVSRPLPPPNRPPVPEPEPQPKPQPPLVDPVPPPGNDPDKWKCCKPCEPFPRGHKLYEIVPPGDRENGRHSRPPFDDGHVKVWTMLQQPHSDCKCFWSKPETFDHTQTPPPPPSSEGLPRNYPPFGGGPL
jgi:hypothetical protein